MYSRTGKFEAHAELVVGGLVCAGSQSSVAFDEDKATFTCTKKKGRAQVWKLVRLYFSGHKTRVLGSMLEVYRTKKGSSRLKVPGTEPRAPLDDDPSTHYDPTQHDW
jgi:hypothetical protein